jgi:hypothetical protein
MSEQPQLVVSKEESLTPAEALGKRLIAIAANDHELVPSGILDRLPSDYSPIRELNGTESATACDQDDWGKVYHEILLSHLRGPELLPYSVVADKAAGLHAEGLTPVFIGDFDYEALVPRFFLRFQKHLAANLSPEAFPLADLPRNEVLESRRTVFASAFLKRYYEAFIPLPLVHKGLEMTFVIPAAGYFTNVAGRHLEQVDADWGLGEGYRPCSFDTPIAIRFPEPGRKEVSLRCRTSQGITYCKLVFEVAVSSAPPYDDYIFLLVPESPYGLLTGKAWIYRGKDQQGNKKPVMTQPVLVAEGFPGGYDIGYLWDKLNQQNLANDLLGKGKDLVIVSFDQGSLAIQASALLVVDCIKKVIEKRSGNEPLVVGGASMGGLVTRYALAYMEKNKMDHQTARYFSIDTPHRGAIVPVSLQLFIQYMRYKSDGAYATAKLLASDAAQQMLLRWVSPDIENANGLPSPKRDKFISDLKAQGWMPAKVKSLGLADGVATGGANDTKAGEKAVWWELNACNWADLYAFPKGPDKQVIARFQSDKVQYGVKWTFEIANGEGLDSGAGGLSEYFKMLYDKLTNKKWLWFPTSCFVPSRSACGKDIWNYFDSVEPGTSDLTEFQCANKNLPHIELSPELAKRLRDFI